MNNTFRNIALALGIATAGLGYNAYTAFQDYKTPELVKTEILDDSTLLRTYRSKDHPVIKGIERMFNLRFYDKRSSVHGGDGGKWTIDLNVSRFEDEAEDIANYWTVYEDSARLPKGNKGWNPVRGVIYNYLKDTLPSERKKEYVDSYVKSTISHERGHEELLKNRTPYFGDEDSHEFVAYREGLKASALDLADLVNFYISKEDSPQKRAATKIIAALLRYPDTPGLYSLVNLPNFKTEIPRRAKSLK